MSRWENVSWVNAVKRFSQRILQKSDRVVQRSMEDKRKRVRIPGQVENPQPTPPLQPLHQKMPALPQRKIGNPRKRWPKSFE